MKSIKLFKYKDSCEFMAFLVAYDYKLEDVKGFGLAEKRQCCGNILKIYNVHFNDGEYEYFKVVAFASFNEYHQARLGFKGDKLLRWYEDAEFRKYKLSDGSYNK